MAAIKKMQKIKNASMVYFAVPAGVLDDGGDNQEICEQYSIITYVVIRTIRLPVCLRPDNVANKPSWYATPNANFLVEPPTPAVIKVMTKRTDMGTAESCSSLAFVTASTGS